MTPLARLICLTVLAVPAFTGLFAFPGGSAIVPGVALSPVIYALLVLGGVAGICGRAFLANAMAVTALIVSPAALFHGSWR